MESILNNPQNAHNLLSMTAGTLLLLDKDGVCVDYMPSKNAVWFFQENVWKGGNIFEFLPLSTYVEFYSNIQDVCNNHLISTHNYEVVLNGRTFYFNCTMQPYGEWVLCECRDTTQRSLEHLKLERRNKELSEIQQIAMIGSWVFNSKTNTIRYTGHGGVMEHEGVIDLNLDTYSSYVLPDDRKNFTEWIIQNMRGNISEPVNFRIRFNDKIFYMKARTLGYERMADGSFIAEGYAHNVTDIQKSRNDINLLTHAVDNAKEYIVAVNKDGNLVFANRMFRKSMDIKLDEDVTSMKIWDIYSIVDDAKMWNYFMGMVKDGNTSQGFIMRSPLQLCPEVLAIEANAYLVTDDSGQETVWMFGRDVTDIVEAARNLKKAKEKAENSERLKSAFLANMSHEIRTPLNAIVGFSRIMSEVDNQEDKKEFCRIIEENNERLLQLINELLDLSKIEANMVNFDIQSINLYDMCMEVNNAFSLRCPPEVELIFESTDKELYALADKNRTIQVISNLVDNALKFTKHGSVRFGYRKCGDKVEIYTTDTGIGIAADKLDSIFGRFVKADDSVNGTGLGLSICKMLVERMNGEMGVESEFGKGTTFHFTLPKV